MQRAEPHARLPNRLTAFTPSHQERYITQTSHWTMCPSICPNPVAQHNDPLERTQAKAQTYLWSRWGQSSPENIHTQSPGKSPCSSLCCGRDQRGRRAPLQNPDGSQQGTLLFATHTLSPQPDPTPGPPA